MTNALGDSERQQLPLRTVRLMTGLPDLTWSEICCTEELLRKDGTTSSFYMTGCRRKGTTPRGPFGITPVAHLGRFQGDVGGLGAWAEFADGKRADSMDSTSLSLNFSQLNAHCKSSIVVSPNAPELTCCRTVDGGHRWTNLSYEVTRAIRA
jgi:hypothetical protein